MAEKRTRLSDMTKAGRKAEKPTVIGAIRDPQFVRDVLQGLGETATRGITGVLGAPVDITTMAMRPFGYSVPAEQVVGGSEYLGKQLERAGMLSGNRNQLSELLAGLVTPDPLDVAKLGAMAVPVVGRAMRQAPRDEAMRIAQTNAAKPISEGGLGLPPDNTAMDRAKAMGFKGDLYHGGTNEFPAFKVSNRSNVYATDNPEISDIYATATGRHKALREINAGPNVIPLMYRGDLLEVTDQGPGGGGWMGENIASAIGLEPKRNIVKEVPSKGFSGVKVTEMDDLGGRQSQYIFPDPTVLRSRFAAFDPARRYESDLLGAADPRLLGAIGLGTAGAIYKTNREKEKDRKREK